MNRSPDHLIQFFFIIIMMASIIIYLTSCTNVQPAPCPTLVHYSKEFEARLLSELEALPPGSAIGQFTADAVAIRAEIAECKK